MLFVIAACDQWTLRAVDRSGQGDEYEDRPNVSSWIIFKEFVLTTVALLALARLRREQGSCQPFHLPNRH